jgi:hypothetical protein
MMSHPAQIVNLFALFMVFSNLRLRVCTAENGQFQNAIHDLETLIQHVGSFVDCWGDMNMSLINLKEILP